MHSDCLVQRIKLSYYWHKLLLNFKNSKWDKLLFFKNPKKITVRLFIFWACKFLKMWTLSQVFQRFFLYWKHMGTTSYRPGILGASLLVISPTMGVTFILDDLELATALSRTQLPTSEGWTAKLAHQHKEIVRSIGMISMVW